MFCYFLYLFKCVSGLSVFVVSGDVFYTLSFYLMTWRTMSRSDWGERVVVDIKKKTNLLTVFAIIKTIWQLLLGWQSKEEFYWLLRRILVNILIKVYQNTSWIFRFTNSRIVITWFCPYTHLTSILKPSFSHTHTLTYDCGLHIGLLHYLCSFVKGNN